MSRPQPIERINTGDRVLIVINPTNEPAVMVVEAINEGETFRMIHGTLDGLPVEIAVEHGRTVDIAC